MNRYHESMEHCAPPPELEEQLREAVLSAEPEPQARTAVYRPRGFFRKALLAAVLAVVLTLSVGAAVLVDWDDIFSDRFGPEGAETPMAEKAFQPVNMTSVCDDVTLTIREALVDEKSIYLILDYQLPDSVDPETVEIAYNSRENTQKDDIKLPMVTYYATDDIAWEDLKAAEQDTWATLDWTDPLTRIFYGKSESTLNRIGRVNGSSGLGETGYDPATNTLSYLCNITGDADSLDFTAQPLTLLVTPPVLRVNGVDTAVTNHPAILTFQPSAVSQTLTGSYRHGGFSARAVLSPLSIYVEVSGGTAYRDTEELVSDTSLLLRDVRYVIEAHFDMTSQAAPGDNPGKFQDIVKRRIKKGQFYHQPCFGCREFPAHFHWCEELPPCPKELLGERDLGWILWDMDYTNPEDIRPLFFRGTLRDGVLEVPARDSGEVRG